MPSGAGISERLALLAGGALALALVQLLQANLKRNSSDDDSQRTTAHNGKVDMSSYSVRYQPAGTRVLVLLCRL